MTPPTLLDGLVHLPLLFDKLRSGRHISVSDDHLFLALRSNFAGYETLFGALGFTLVRHERGFYYFQSPEDLGKGASKMAVFFFVLVEAWGDDGRDLEEVAFDEKGHALAELPHFTREGWRQCLTDAELSTDDDLAQVVRRMEQYGFAERINEGSRFRFLMPAWRFFDLCLDVLRSESEEANERSEEANQ